MKAEAEVDVVEVAGEAGRAAADFFVGKEEADLEGDLLAGEDDSV